MGSGNARARPGAGTTRRPDPLRPPPHPTSLRAGQRLASLSRLPGLLGLGQRHDLLGELACRNVGDGYLLEHFAQVGAQGDPDLLQLLGRADVLDLLRALAADADERALDRADDLSEAALVGRLREPIPTLGATLAANDPR